MASLDGKPVTFIGLERTSGVFAYDLSIPEMPHYLGYINTLASGDISPEGLIFVSLDPQRGLLVVTNELSNTISTYEITLVSDDAPQLPGLSIPPHVSESSIEWSDEGYWQVQTADTYQTICEGSAVKSCAVEPGIYTVINLSSGTRFENIAAP